MRHDITRKITQNKIVDFFALLLESFVVSIKRYIYFKTEKRCLTTFNLKRFLLISSLQKPIDS